MTTVPTQPYRPPSSAGCGVQPSVFESILMGAGRALMLAGERRARRNAFRRRAPRLNAPAAVLLAHEELRRDAQAAAHSGLRVC